MQQSVSGLSLAEMAELLTPFLSPSATPLGLAPNSTTPTANVFSPLTSPALLPSRAASATAHQLAGLEFQPPPLPPSSATEHTFRRQQQQQQHMGEHFAPSLPAAAAWSASARGRRVPPPNSGSPHHHPYRTPGGSRKQGRALELGFSPAMAAEASMSLPVSAGVECDGFLLDAFAEPPAAMAMIASLHSTPSMRAASTMAADFAGLHLPDAVDASLAAAAEEQHNAAQRSRTLHQLNSPQQQQQQHDMAAWLSQPPTSAGSSSGSSIMATPAMLMNLPVSAHHLPHTSTGEIVAVGPHPLQTVDTAPNLGDSGSSRSGSVAARHSLPAGAQSAPMADFVHPPQPPPLRIGPPSAAPPADCTRRVRRTSVSAADAAPPTRTRRGDASRARRRSRAALLSPRTTPLVPSILKGGSGSGTSPMASPAAGPQHQSAGPPTPAIAPRQHQGAGRGSATTTPRAIVAATSTTNIVGLESDVVTRLATKSNYQNIMEGNSEMLGLKYHTEFKSGLERRRTNHKQAEQKRRDSLKVCFHDLKARLPGVDPKLASKIHLLRTANDYIDELEKVSNALAAAARACGLDVDAIAAATRQEHRAGLAAMDEDPADGDLQMNDDMDSS
ncbi:hypothetical protein H4R19_004355 [Coemansia spiralis]|nr:hypothetical protein H4R19_004355 [Coemansia spiralis]